MADVLSFPEGRGDTLLHNGGNYLQGYSVTAVPVELLLPKSRYVTQSGTRGLNSDLCKTGHKKICSKQTEKDISKNGRYDVISLLTGD
jgi:hypothetical protein